MSTNTTRPVAVKAVTQHARRSFGDEGVPANGNTPPAHHAQRKWAMSASAETVEQATCRTCRSPIWNEGGTIAHQRHNAGWSDRVKAGGDSLVCFKAINYRHEPDPAR